MPKLYYTLNDFRGEDGLTPLITRGKNWQGICPECNHKSLYISKESGLFNCFHCGQVHGRVRTAPMCENENEDENNSSGANSAYSTSAHHHATDSAPHQTDGSPNQADGGPHQATIAARQAAAPCAAVHDCASAPFVAASFAASAAAATATPARSGVRMIPEDYAPVSDDLYTATAPFQPGHPEALPDTIRLYLERTHHSLDTLAALDVRWQGDRIVYVNHVNGRRVNIKYRNVTDKTFSQQSPTTPCAPYHIDCINPLLLDDDRVERLIITEGEKDAITLIQCGYRYVVSIANGAKTDVAKSFEAFEPWLAQVRNIVVCGDSDRPGRELAEALTQHFGARTMRCTMPHGCKDISDVFVAYGEEGVRTVVESAERAATQHVLHIADITDKVLRRAHGDYDHGYAIGMGPLTDEVFHLNDNGGLIIVTGEPNAGKTDFLDCICAHLIWHCNRNVVLCSFEMPDKVAHTERYLRLATGTDDLSLFDNEDLRPLCQHLDRHLTHIVLDDGSAPTPENILLAADNVFMETSVHFLVIDPYLYLDLKGTTRDNETQTIRRMLTTFQLWGRQHHAWVIIVAHPRKLNKIAGTNDLEEIDKYTIGGSAHWANIADFILSVRRVRKDAVQTTTGIALDYTEMHMLKVRDQTQCHTGTVLYNRQPCGRYDERPDLSAIEAAAEAHAQANPLPPGITQDISPWQEGDTNEDENEYVDVNVNEKGNDAAAP